MIVLGHLPISLVRSAGGVVHTNAVGEGGCPSSRPLSGKPSRPQTSRTVSFVISHSWDDHGPFPWQLSTHCRPSEGTQTHRQ
jgi:hypothetical protein